MADAPILIAIREHRLLRFHYDGFERLVEPHVLGMKVGRRRILAYQVGGFSRSGRIPDWRYFDVDQMQGLELLDEKFVGTRAGNRPRSAFDQVLSTVAPAATHAESGLGSVNDSRTRIAIPERPLPVREPRYRAFRIPNPATQAAESEPLPTLSQRNSPVLLADVTGPVRAAIAPHLRERATTLREDIQAVVHNHVARGTLTSGMFIGDVYKVCAKEVDYRVDYVWARLAQGLTHARLTVSSSLLEDIGGEINGYRADTLEEIQAVLDGEERRSGFTSHRDLSREWDHAVERVLGEASMEILKMHNEEKPVTPLTVNFNAPGGVFQQGNHNIVNQQWDLQDLELVRILLNQLEEQIPLVEMEPLQRDEATAMVQDTRTELTKRRPHWAGALQALTTLRQVIENVKELRPLYEQIGVFLRTHGVHLPGVG